jgi:hypothetical protein
MEATMVRTVETGSAKTRKQEKDETFLGEEEKSFAPKRVKKVEHKAFAQRMAQACDGNTHVPPPNFGRLQWFVDQMQEKFGADSTPETIRKWFAGEALPRPRSMHMLAEILGVDEAWLSLGHAPELDQRQQKLRNAEADGVVNVVAGFIQMCGSNPAFPEASDKRAQKEHIDLYAIIRGAQYAFHVALEKDGRYVVPVGAEDVFVIGALRTDDLECQFYEVDASAGKRKGGFIEVEAAGQKRIRTFSERL